MKLEDQKMVKIWANLAQITRILYFTYGKMTNMLEVIHKHPKLDGVNQEDSAEVLMKYSVSRKSCRAAFPNRKSCFFDNKLEFSGTKLAES